MNNRKVWILGIGVFLVLGLGGWMGINRFRPYAFHGTLLQSPEVVPDFTLTSHMGQPVSLSDFRGQLVLLYFGYTTCPDVCPTTLAELHQARLALGKNTDQVQVLMVTIDPERDDVAKMAGYVPQFDPTFLGLTGTPDEIAQVATYYGIYYARQEGDSALGYLMDHTATQLLIDREGHLRVVYAFGTTGEDVASDLEYILKR